MSDEEDPPEHWERQPGESAKSYEAFVIYRDMGPSRTLPRVRETLGRPSGYQRWLETWSSSGGWVARAIAWDDRVDEERRAEGFDAARAAARREGLTADEGWVYGQGLLDELEADEELTLEDAARAFNVVTQALERIQRIGRLARGQATQRSEVSGSSSTDRPMGELTDEELARIIEDEGKAAG